MGLATEGDDISIYKAYIKAYIRDANSLKNPALPSLFGKGNKLNLRPVPSFLPILTAVEELLIAYVYTVSNITILTISAALAKIH